MTSKKIRFKANTKCILCSTHGNLLYKNMQDRLFGAPGDWSIRQCTNRSCNLNWLDPKPIEKDIYLAYKNYITHYQPKTHHHNFYQNIMNGYHFFKYNIEKNTTTNKMYQYIGGLLSIFKFFKENMDYRVPLLIEFKGKEMLEFGSGSGNDMLLFKEMGINVQGIDTDPQAVKAAKKKGLNVFKGNIFSSKLKKNSFDVVFSSHVIEHAYDPIKLTKRAKSLLKNGGVFISITPNGKSFLHKIFKRNWRGLEPPRHFYIFNPINIKKMALECHFKRVMVFTGNYTAAGVFHASAVLAGYPNKSMASKFLLKLLSQISRFLLNFIHYIFPLSGEELIVIAYK